MMCSWKGFSVWWMVLKAFARITRIFVVIFFMLWYSLLSLCCLQLSTFTLTFGSKQCASLTVETIFSHVIIYILTTVYIFISFKIAILICQPLQWNSDSMKWLGFYCIAVHSVCTKCGVHCIPVVSFCIRFLLRRPLKVCVSIHISVFIVLSTLHTFTRPFTLAARQSNNWVLA